MPNSEYLRKPGSYAIYLEKTPIKLLLLGIRKENAGNYSRLINQTVLLMSPVPMRTRISTMHDRRRMTGVDEPVGFDELVGGAPCFAPVGAVALTQKCER